MVEKMELKNEKAIKQKLGHDELYGKNWGEKEKDWLLFCKNDVLSTTFSYARLVKVRKD